MVGIIADGIHAYPAMINIACNSKGKDTLILVTDAMGAFGMPYGKYSLNEFEILIDETGAHLPDGTLVGSILSTDQELRNLIAFTGCSISDALRTITLNHANLLHLKTKGYIKVGYDADLVFLTASGKIKATMKNGELVYQKDRSLEVISQN